ncbi:hypothetical protein Dsin_021545 [Dipteronia sinensis]|uniref:Phytocyanin domain-containing protein n=1 Tax=Dipteronia sinensis TaxID=43782 RepID=A0AAE0DYX2_9ROSI|nr:hypothetical protein Dsin_021545 [Dipteronia sinensis]
MSFPIISSATEFVVGDDSGWTLGFDYQDWAEGKNFQGRPPRPKPASLPSLVGDKIVFKYLEGAHTVFKVNGTSFQNCIKPPANEALTSGNDTIVLATPGNKRYICGVGSHCNFGQK